MENDVLVIGIADGTASGKTTLMKNLIGEFGAEVTVLSHDNYYKRHDEMPFEERCTLNYDEPAAFDTSLMVYHLDQLRHGQAIECPVYDFTVHNRSSETIRLVPKKVIIVEGILIFENEDLRNLMDIKIRIKRGRSLESVLEQYQATVKPMHERYVEPSKRYADLVVPEGGKNLVALTMITGHIRHYLDEGQDEI